MWQQHATNCRTPCNVVLHCGQRGRAGDAAAGAVEVEQPGTQVRDGGTCGRRVRLRPRLLLRRHAAHKGSPLGDAQLWGSVSQPARFERGQEHTRVVSTAGGASTNQRRRRQRRRSAEPCNCTGMQRCLHEPPSCWAIRAPPRPWAAAQEGSAECDLQDSAGSVDCRGGSRICAKLPTPGSTAIASRCLHAAAAPPPARTCLHAGPLDPPLEARRHPLPPLNEQQCTSQRLVGQGLRLFSKQSHGLQAAAQRETTAAVMAVWSSSAGGGLCGTAGCSAAASEALTLEHARGAAGSGCAYRRGGGLQHHSCVSEQAMQRESKRCALEKV